MSARHKPLGIVFDCMVFIQAAANRDSVAARALRLIETGEIKVFVSVQILKEIRDVFSRPKIRAQLKGITDTTMEALFLLLERDAYLVTDIPGAFKYSRDPKDEPYINLAIAAGADCIVSRDNDLLDLMTGHTTECKEFRQRFRPLRVIEPLTLLEEIMKRRQTEEVECDE